MTVKDYMEKAGDISKREFMSRMDLARELNIAYNTLSRLERNPESCSLKTMKKIKAFVDKYESKNITANS